MSDDWLQLTDDDIDRAQRLIPARSPMPEVITIRPSDIPAEEPPQPTGSAVISVTMEDLAPTEPQLTTTADLSELERLMYELVNNARADHLPAWVGTSELKWHGGLAAVARGHSADMLRRQFVSHISPEGVTASRRIEHYGISYVACGENIGVFYGATARTEQAVHDIYNAFMNQPRSLTNHRGNLLNPIWTHVGIGIAHNPAGSLVATQNFISAPAARLRGR